MSAHTRMVWVEDLECCGDPFAVGSRVTWELAPADHEQRFLTDLFGARTGSEITDLYERHGTYDPTTPVTGVIRSIEAVSWLVHPFADDTPEMDERSQYVAPESAAIETKLSAQRGDQVGGRSCMGYLVELDVDSA